MTFLDWLLERGVDRATAEKYVRQVTTAGNRPLDWARESGFCPADKTLPELAVWQLYRIHAASPGAMSDAQRTTVKWCRDYRFWLEEREPAPAGEAGVSLYPILEAVRKASEDKRAPDLLMGALMLEQRHYDPTKDLRPGGARYPLCRRVALEQWEHCRREVRSALEGALLRLSGQMYGLRELLCQAAGRLTAKWGDTPGFRDSETQRLLLQMEGLNPDFSAREMTEQTDWYAMLSERELLEHMAELLAELLIQGLEQNGRGFPPQTALRTERREDLLMLTLLTPFRQVFTYGQFEGVSFKHSRRLAQLLRLGLLRVERVKGKWHTARLVPTGLTGSGAVRAEQLPLMEEVWQDRECCTLLKELVGRLDERQRAEDPDLDRETLFALAPELVLLLAAAPAEDGETLQAKSERQETVELLTAVLVRCHWANRAGGPSRQSVESLGRLIDLCKARPAAAMKALEPLMARPGGGERAAADLARRMELDELGGSLVLAELHIQRADQALTLAALTPEGKDLRDYWAVCAAASAREGRAIAVRLGEYVLAVRAALLRAEALAVGARLAVEQPGQAARCVLADFVIPCGEELEQCRGWLENELPGQRRSVELLGGSLPQEVLDRCRGSAEEVAGLCAQMVFGEGSEVRTLLRQDAGLWPAIPHDFAVAGWRGLAKKLALDCVPREARGQVLAWIPHREAKRDLFLPWYCSYLDSALCARKQYRQERVEAYLMKILLSAQNVVLTLNQVVDNALIRSLAHSAGFLWALRSGRVAVSLFGNAYNLCEYAAAQMEKEPKKYKWSSLPPVLNYDMRARRDAARCLRGECGAEALGGQFRETVMQMKEDLTILDENLPAAGRLYYYQRRTAPLLADRLNEYYDRWAGRLHLEDLRYVHETLMECWGERPIFRTDYQELAESLGKDELDIPAHRRAYFRSRQWAENHELLLEQAINVLDDTQNRLLGGQFTNYQHHVYTREERLLLPYDETTPISQGGCRIFRDTLTLTETGEQVGWDQLAERAQVMDDLVRADPGITKEGLANALGNAALDYTVSDDGDVLRLRRAAVHTSNHKKVLVEQKMSEGMIHMETEGGFNHGV